MEEFKKAICDLLDSMSLQKQSAERQVEELTARMDAGFSQLSESMDRKMCDLEERYGLLKSQFEMIVEENKVLRELNEDLTQRINDLYDAYADRNMDLPEDEERESFIEEEEDNQVEQECVLQKEPEPAEPADLAEPAEPADLDSVSEPETETPLSDNSVEELERQQEEGAEVFRVMQEVEAESGESEEKRLDEEIEKMDQRLFMEENPDDYAYSLFDAKFKQTDADGESGEVVSEDTEEDKGENDIPEQADSLEDKATALQGDNEEIELSLFDTLIKNDAGQRPLWITDNPGPAVSKITHGITINDKIMYINTLFNGDSVLYKRTMSLLEDFPTFGEAYTFLREQFPDWDENSSEVYSFYMTVRRKLRS